MTEKLVLAPSSLWRSRPHVTFSNDVHVHILDDPDSGILFSTRYGSGQDIAPRDLTRGARSISIGVERKRGDGENGEMRRREAEKRGS